MVGLDSVDDIDGLLDVEPQPDQLVLRHLQILVPLVLAVAVQLACVLVDVVGNHQEVVEDVFLSGQDVSQWQLGKGQGVSEHGHEEVVDLQGPAQNRCHALCLYVCMYVCMYEMYVCITLI